MSSGASPSPVGAASSRDDAAQAPRARASGRSFARPAAAVLSGILLALAFPSPDIEFLAWIALTPLLLAIDGIRTRRALRIGWLSGVTFFALTLSWILRPMVDYTPIPYVVAVAILLLVCAVLGLTTAAFASAVAFVSRRGVSSLWFAPCWWVAIELARSRFAVGFPWNLLGYSQYRTAGIVQLAEVTGVFGLSALIVFTSALFARAVRPGIGVGRRTALAAVAILLILTAHVVGDRRRAEIVARTPTEHLRAAVIQGSIPQELKWNPDYQESTLTTYEILTRSAAKFGLGLIVWPETATPFFFQMDSEFSTRVRELARQSGAWLLFGSPGFEQDVDGELASTNRAFVLSPSGAQEGFYDKVVLVPFGEYVPLQRVLFFIKKLAHSVASIKAGAGPMALPAGSQQAGVLICYEAIFPFLARGSMAAGATVLVNITNDAWFGQTAAPYQHLAMAVLRAVENRVPLIRAANTGISAFITPDGRIEQPTPLFEPTYRIADLAWRPEPTLYTRYGDVFAGGLGIAALAMLVVAAFARPR